jgi:cell division protein FtsQ
MKKRSILSGQSVQRRHSRNYSGIFRMFKSLSLLSLKIICLLTVVASISFLFIYLYQYLISSPYVKLKEVRIIGVDDKIKRELIEISDLDSEKSLLTIDLKAIKKKMESLPWVRKVELEKSFPNVLLVRVEKEIPFAIVVLDKLYYIDRRGVPFKELEYSDNKDFPVITGIPSGSADKDHYMKLAAGILSAFESGKDDWSMDDLSELHFEKDESVSLYSTSTPLVLKMGYNKLALKKKELKRILSHLKKTGRMNMVKTIDLNYSDGAVVSFRDAG